MTLQVRATTKPLRRERGASLVEFALLAPVLFAILLGTITGGLALAAKNSMTNAVREGGRLGATLYSDDASWDWDDWAVDVRDRVDSLAGGDLDTSQICVQLVDVANPSPPLASEIGSDCPVGDAPDTPSSATAGCIVKVWATRSADLNTIFFTRTLTLDASAIGIYERDGCP